MDHRTVSEENSIDLGERGFKYQIIFRVDAAIHANVVSCHGIAASIGYH